MNENQDVKIERRYLEIEVRAIQEPPFARVGVMDLDSFYPSKERFQLAMRFNNLLAAPGFEAWLEGEPMDIGRLLFTAEGRPRASIFTISHLGEAERMLQPFTHLDAARSGALGDASGLESMRVGAPILLEELQAGRSEQP